MSGITGKDALGLFEAYHAIYAPQEELDEGLRPLPKEKMERQATKAYGKEVRAAAAGDEKETNKQMKRRIAIQSPASRRTELLNKEEVDIFDVVLEFLQSEGIAETLEEAEWTMANLVDEEIIADILDEASYSAKAARKGKDIGKPGKAFAKIAASAGKRYGSKERGEKVAGAVLAKLRAKGG